MYTTFCLLIFLLINTRLFHHLVIENNIAMNKWVHKYLFECLLSTLWGIYLETDLLGHMAILFYFLQNCQAVLHSSYTIFTFLPAVHESSTSLSTLFPIFLKIAIIVGVKWLGIFLIAAIFYPASLSVVEEGAFILTQTSLLATRSHLALELKSQESLHLKVFSIG